MARAGGALTLCLLAAACGISAFGTAVDGGASAGDGGHADGPARAVDASRGESENHTGDAHEVGAPGDPDSRRSTDADPHTRADALTAADAKLDADARVMDDESSVPTLTVDLGTAGNYVILAETAITTVPISAITGDMGVSPAAAAAITGFSLTAGGNGQFSTSAQVTGNVYAADDAVPTPGDLTIAIGDLAKAFTDAASRAPAFTELGAGSIGGMTLTPGVYRWSSGLLIPSDVTLSGSATDVWILEIAQTLTMAASTHVVLTGGAAPKNVFWQVAGAVTVGAGADFEGILLAGTSVSLGTSASISGRLLAETAVTLAGNVITGP